MSELKPEKIDLSQINSGNKYKNGDVVDANAINSAVQASAYAQALATNQPNLENADKYGNPKVSIEEVGGLPRFKFENIKGTRDSQIVKNQNNISAIFSVLQNKQITQVAEDVPNNKAFRQTGEYSYFDEDLWEDVTGTLDVVDGSYTKVTKIQGKGTLLGIKSTSRNLIPILSSQPFDGVEENGVTCVNNSDGTYTLNGTATAEVRLNLYQNTTFFQKIKGGKTYSFSGVLGGGSHNTYLMEGYCYYPDGTSQSVGYKSYAGLQTFTPKADGYINCQFVVRAGQTVDNLVFKPMLCVGDTPIPYEEFESYKESIMELPALAELGEWDYIKNNKLYKQTSESYDFDGSENWEITSDKSFGLNVKNSYGFRIIGVKNTGVYSFAPNGGNAQNGYVAILIRATQLPYTPTGTTDEELLNEWKTYLSNNPFSAVFKKFNTTVTDFTFDNEYQVWNGGTEQMLLEGEDVPTIYNEYLVYFGEE